MAQLTQADKAEKFDNLQMKRKEEKVDQWIDTLRGIEVLSTGAVSVGTGMVKAARPAWEQAAYGLVIDGVTFGLGFAGFVAAGRSKKKSVQAGAEFAGGMMHSGIANLGTKAGARLYAYLTK